MMYFLSNDKMQTLPYQYAYFIANRENFVPKIQQMLWSCIPYLYIKIIDSLTC